MESAIAFTDCDLLAAARAQARPAARGKGRSKPAGRRPHMAVVGRRRAVVVGGRRAKTIDVHAHCVIPEAYALLGLKVDDHRGPGIGEVGPRRIAEMDAQGIDMEALSINPAWYGAERNVATRVIKIQNERLAEFCATYSGSLRRLRIGRAPVSGPGGPAARGRREEARAPRGRRRRERRRRRVRFGPLLGGGAEAEGRVVLGAAGFAATPAERASVAAEQVSGFDLGLVDGRWTLRARGDVQRVGRAVDLTEEARLAVGRAGDDRRRPRPRLEDVGRADLDADVARDAAAREDEIEHARTLRPQTCSARAVLEPKVR